MSTFDESAVRQVARLARLDLSELEVAAFGRELGAILEYVAQLEQVDVQGVEPTCFAGGEGRFRPAGLRIELTPGQAVEGAPDAEGTSFRVPRVIG